MKINKQLREAIRALMDLKCVLPGKVREISVTCGTPGCKCMKKDNPRKHTGRQMSYTYNHKTKTLSVRKADVSKVEALNLNYKKLREATTVFAHEFTEMVKVHGLEESEKIVDRYIDGLKRENVCSQPKAQQLREIRASRDKWKAKALARQSDLAAKAVRIRDLEASRDNWKNKAADARKRLDEVQKELGAARKKLDKTAIDEDLKKLFVNRTKKSF